MGADDVWGFGSDAGEGVYIDEFGEGTLAHVEEGENGDACVGVSRVGADFQETFFFVAGVDADGFADDGGSQDDGFVVDGAGGHGGEEGEVVLTRFVGEVDGAAGDAATRGVESGVWVASLEHVPIGQDIQMGSEQGVVGVDEDVPRVRGGHVREEIVGVADHEAGFVERELGVEEDLGDLGHAGDGLYGEVAEGVYGPGVLEGGDEAAAVGGGGEEVEGELGVGFDGVDAGGEEESASVGGFN